MFDTPELCAHCLDYRLCSFYPVEVAHSYLEGRRMSMLRLSEGPYRFALVAWLLYAITTFGLGDVRDGNRG